MKQQNKEVKLIELGVKPYQTAWDFQEELFQKIIAVKRSNREEQAPTPTPNYLLWVEHPPVYTLGKSGDLAHLLLNKHELQQKGITFFKTNRGGDITFHGPGQIVGYPIFDLDNFFTDIHKYLRLLEQVVIDTLDYYTIKGERSPGETGVWLDVNTPFARKICAMGVRASRWVTMHGFAFNVNADLKYFGYIVPCGIKDKHVTSLSQELGRHVEMNEVLEPLVSCMNAVFNVQVDLFHGQSAL